MTTFLKLHEDMKIDPLDHARVHVQATQQLRDLDALFKDFDTVLQNIRVGLGQCQNRCDNVTEECADLFQELKVLVDAGIAERVEPLEKRVSELEKERESLHEHRGWRRLFACCYRRQNV